MGDDQTNRLRIGGDPDFAALHFRQSPFRIEAGVLAVQGKLAHDAPEMTEYRNNPAVHLFGDTVEALERMRRSAAAVDCRIVSAGLIPSDMDDFLAVPGAGLLIELADVNASEAAIGLLDWAERQAERGVRRSVVAAPAALLDLIAARTPHADVAQLCAPDEAERRFAIALAGQPIPARLYDIGRENGALILQQLSQDVSRIAAQLAQLSDEETATSRPMEDSADDSGIDASYIRAMIRARRLRDQYFRGDLFADPAWDMLLDLMAARLEKNRVAVSSLCIAAAVPATTALRWIKALTDRGLLVRAADPQDGRRVYIELSDETARSIAAYLRAAQRISTIAV